MRFLGLKNFLQNPVVTTIDTPSDNSYNLIRQRTNSVLLNGAEGEVFGDHKCASPAEKSEKVRYFSQELDCLLPFNRYRYSRKFEEVGRGRSIWASSCCGWDVFRNSRVR